MHRALRSYKPRGNKRRVREFKILSDIYSVPGQIWYWMYRSLGVQSFEDVYKHVWHKTFYNRLGEPNILSWELLRKVRRSNVSRGNDVPKDRAYIKRTVENILFNNTLSITSVSKFLVPTDEHKVTPIFHEGMKPVTVSYISIIEYMAFLYFERNNIHIAKHLGDTLLNLGTLKGYLLLHRENNYFPLSLIPLSRWYDEYGGAPSEIYNYGLEI